jgi:acetyltransferase-like isoleucine patch superfamily enzyme
MECKIKFWIYGSYGVANCLKLSPYPFIQLILRTYGAKIGSNCVIDTGLTIHRPDKYLPFKNLEIGDNVYIGHNVLFDLTAKIVIQNDIGVGAGCQFWTHTGEFKKKFMDKEHDYHEEILDITIEKNTIFYSGVITSPGVTVGKYSRIGAASFINKNTESHSFYAGVPARKIKDLA